MSWAYKLLARDGKLLTRAGKGIVLTDANQSAIEDCCCGDPCASGCGYIDLAGPWGVWRLNRRGDLDPDNPNFYDYIGDDGQAGIADGGAGFAAWDVGRLHCSFAVSCDGNKTAVDCVACYDLDSYDLVPCPGLSVAGGCYAPCCACGLPENDLPQTLYIAVALTGGTCAPQPPPVPLHTLTLAQVTPAGAAYMGSSPYSVLYASADTGQLSWSIGYQSLVPYPTGCNADCPPYSVSGWATIVCPDGLQAGYYPLKKGDVLGGQVNFECRDPATGAVVYYYATYKGTISW